MAFDVGYQLNNTILPTSEEPKISLSFAITLTDRVWAAPGIEQAQCELVPAKEFDFTEPNPSRIIHTVRSKWSVRSEDSPQWLDIVAWPRTRELYGLGLPSAYDDQQEFTFGGITFQR
jgi:hypothetical protein